MLVVETGAYNVVAGVGPYSVSKTALVGLTKVAAKELAGENVTVNCVAPGLVKTNFSEKDGFTKTFDAISKLVKDIEPNATRARDSITNLAQKALDDMLSTTGNIQNQIVSSHEKTHKN